MKPFLPINPLIYLITMKQEYDQNLSEVNILFSRITSYVNLFEALKVDVTFMVGEDFFLDIEVLFSFFNVFRF